MLGDKHPLEKVIETLKKLPNRPPGAYKRGKSAGVVKVPVMVTINLLLVLSIVAVPGEAT
jgi:hypothetical protein